MAVAVYSRCNDQWRYSSETGTMTIDNGNIEVVMDAMQIDIMDRLAVFDDVKTIIGEIAGLIAGEQQKQREKAREKKNGSAQNRSHRR